jgi:MFS transporter, SP family, solute carrier family 2 (myo-inositol transporter), member 13
MSSTEKSEGLNLTDGSTNGADSLKDVIRDIDSGEINELAVVAEGEERATWFVWILVLCSTISGLLFGEWILPMLFVYLAKRNTGYDTGVISGALVTIGSDLGPAELSNGQKVSILLLGPESRRFLFDLSSSTPS